MKFIGFCLSCGSSDIEVYSSTEVSWGNNDQGVLQEDWICHSCHFHFRTEGFVEVTKRELVEVAE